jgi:hypothetical protein
MAKSEEELSGAAVDEWTSTSGPRERPGPNMRLGPVSAGICQYDVANLILSNNLNPLDQDRGIQ